MKKNLMNPISKKLALICRDDETNAEVYTVQGKEISEQFTNLIEGFVNEKMAVYSPMEVEYIMSKTLGHVCTFAHLESCYEGDGDGDEDA